MGILCCKCRRPPKDATVQDGHTGDDGPGQTLQLPVWSPPALPTSSVQGKMDMSGIFPPYDILKGGTGYGTF